MKRQDYVKLILKLHDEIRYDNIFSTKIKKLTTTFLKKKKANLFKKPKAKIYSYTITKYKGIKIYLIQPSKKGYAIVYDVSPIDAPYLEYMTVTLDGRGEIFTQHLLDRYNQRILDKRMTSYKEVLIDFILKTNQEQGTHISIDSEKNKVVMRIEDGFIMGSDYENYSVFNTIYESKEEKDNEIKRIARDVKNVWDEYSFEQREEYIKLDDQLIAGNITKEEFEYQIHIKGLDLNK